MGTSFMQSAKTSEEESQAAGGHSDFHECALGVAADERRVFYGALMGSVTRCGVLGCSWGAGSSSQRCCTAWKCCRQPWIRRKISYEQCRLTPDQHNINSAGQMKDKHGA